MIKIKSFVILGIVIILYSNFFTAFCVNYIHDTGKYIPLSKDLYVIFLIFTFLYLTLKVKSYLKVNRYIFAFLLCMSVAYIYSSDGIYNKTYNLRRITLPLIIFTIFSNINIKTCDHSFYFKFIKYNFILFCLFGILEYFNTRFFWDYLISVNKYWAVNSVESHGMVDFFTDGGRLYTSDTLAFFGFKMRRMISFSLEPTTFAAFMLFCFTIFLYHKKYILTSLALLFGILTLSKLFIIGTILILIQKLFNLYNKFYIYFGTLILFCICKYIYQLTFNIHGSFSHLKGFYTGFLLLKEQPFGFGLGIAGNRGSQYISTMHGDFGGESGLGNILAQVGILGLFYLFIIIMFYFKIYKSKSLDNNNKNISFALITQYLLNFYLSASSLGVLSFYFIFAHLGLTWRNK
jgi:hypothetical protein